MNVSKSPVLMAVARIPCMYAAGLPAPGVKALKEKVDLVLFSW